MNSSFGHYLKQRRMELKLTQQQLADKMGVAQAYITYLENDVRNASDEILEKISQCLELPLEELFLRANPKIQKVFKRENFSGKGLPTALLALKNDSSLRGKHDVTDAEIEMLGSLQMRGQIKKVDDYVFLLHNIRRVLKD